MYQAFVVLMFILIVLACGKEKQAEATKEEAVQFHADNDIAMAVCSIADAISVGEELNPDDYNFQGILTDGEGRPLYTDIHGNPGEWMIDINSPSSAVLQNIEYGDLLPDELEQYILAALQAYNMQPTEIDDYADDFETAMSLYESEKFSVNFIRRDETTQTGVESVLLNIVIASK